MTAFVLGVLAMAGVVLTPVEVVATSYTCEPIQQNPMHPCGPLRYGGDVHSHGMACPPEWAGTAFFVPGQENVLVCDDTPRHASLNGLAHIDLRLPTYDAAIRYGVRRVVVYRVEYSPLYATKGERYEQ